jgi:hypothetical protein
MPFRAFFVALQPEEVMTARAGEWREELTAGEASFAKVLAAAGDSLSRAA